MISSRRLRFIMLVAALIFLAFLPWDTRTKAPFHDEVRGVVHKALDDFVLKFLSNLHSDSEVPEGLTKALEIQSLLSCPIQTESRVTMSGPNLLIPTTCSYAFPPVEEICQLLPGSRVLLVGPETTHFLHSLWLDVVEGRRNRTHTCPGREYCTFHHICRTPTSPEDSDTYDRAGRKKKMPSDNFLTATLSALLQYTYSTTLYAASNKSDQLYQSPLVDLETGVQQVSQYWSSRARKADVIVLSRAPLPAPVSTYTLGPSGNWTFASALCSQQKHFPTKYCSLSLPYALAIAALDMTLRNFLPSVIETIRKLPADSLFQGPLRIWHGNWVIQAPCAVKRLSRDTQLLPDFWSCTDLLDSCQTDPWSYFYNVQGTIVLHLFVDGLPHPQCDPVYLQDRILPRILPYYGIIYLPLTLSIFDQGPELKEIYDRPEYVNDCIREPWPSFPEELVQAFLIKLAALLTLRHI